ncbi:MmgE/PrpD family protein [uncultured Shimia sp.]|uniref:MmgE/PrpD family protein n=1 Tax=uncultured Shimia sp. TaxID=573152 RepID=UPI00262FBE44|nr:MmgE/PrpD family protein [uncultured Shimia sp.]
MHTAEKIARYAFQTYEDALTDNVLDVMRLSLLDWASVARAAVAEPVAIAAWAMEHSNGGYGVASVIDRKIQLPMRGAAMVNGVLGHALDYDDTHFAHIGHVSAVVLPAVLAVAEDQEESLDAALRATVVGAEAAIRTGLWLGRPHYEAGFHQTATAGIFGATAGAAALMRDLSSTEVAQAVALAGSRAGGLKAHFGTMAKPYHAGMAAAGAVESLMAVSYGVEANPAALDGPLGYGVMHGGICDATAFDAKGYLWPAVSHKLHACCHGTHAAIEALRGFQGQAVEAVEIAVHPRWLDVCNIPAPQTRLEAKFSLTLTGAMSLLGLPLTTDQSFEENVILSAEVVELRDKITVVGDSELADTAAVVQVQTGGKVETAHHDLADVADFATRKARVREKSHALIGADLSDALWEEITSPNLPSARRFMEVLQSQD